jgi:hypothetical protein
MTAHRDDLTFASTQANYSLILFSRKGQSHVSVGKNVTHRASNSKSSTVFHERAGNRMTITLPGGF